LDYLVGEMTPNQLNEVVDTFLTIWKTHSLPPDCAIDVRAMSLDEAYAVQRRVIEHPVSLRSDHKRRFAPFVFRPHILVSPDSKTIIEKADKHPGN
jgi:hypothetical protein